MSEIGRDHFGGPDVLAVADPRYVRKCKEVRKILWMIIGIAGLLGAAVLWILLTLAAYMEYASSLPSPPTTAQRILANYFK